MKIRFLHIFFVLFVWSCLNNSFTQVVPGDSLKAKVTDTTFKVQLGETIKLSEIQPGDLMFFKGSNVNSSVVGHVAMVVEVTPSAIKFIHSANGGVRIDNFKTSEYYIRRYVKTKRLDYGG